MRICGVIPARGGSKGIPNKNIKEFLGKPLLSWTIEQLLDAGVAEVYVSTDSKDIADVAENSGAYTISRPSHLASDSAQSEHALLHAAHEIGLARSDGMLFAQATSPLRRIADLKSSIRTFELDPASSLFSAVRQDDLTGWIELNGRYESFPSSMAGGRTARQVRPATYLETGSFYLTSIGSLESSGSRIGQHFRPFEVPGWTLHELDNMADWQWMEQLMEVMVVNGRGY